MGQANGSNAYAGYQTEPPYPQLAEQQRPAYGVQAGYNAYQPEYRQQAEYGQQGYAYQPEYGRQGMLSDDKQNESDFASADAYGTISIISALMFGAALAVLFEVDPADESKFGDSPISKVIFSIAITVTCALSGYSTIIMVVQQYHIKRLASHFVGDAKRGYKVNQFIKSNTTKLLRDSARNAMVPCMVSFFWALAVHTWNHVKPGYLAVVLSLIFVATSVLSVAGTYLANDEARRIETGS